MQMGVGCIVTANLLISDIVWIVPMDFLVHVWTAVSSQGITWYCPLKDNSWSDNRWNKAKNLGKQLECWVIFLQNDITSY